MGSVCMPSLDEIERVVLLEFGMSAEALRARNRKGVGVPRGVFIELACRVGAASQRQVAAHLGTVSEHSVGKTRKTLAEQLASDRNLREQFRRLISSF